jgi:hypothetical protein
MLPDYFERREEQIEEVADLQKRIAKLRLYGPRSKDDLFLIYMIHAGKLQVPSGAIWDPNSWYTDEQKKDNFSRGLFNPRRYVSAPGRKGPYEDRWANGNPADKYGAFGANYFGMGAGTPAGNSFTNDVTGAFITKAGANSFKAPGQASRWI